MIKHIFKFELDYWFNRWQFYIYMAIAFAAGYLTMVASGGLFDGNTATVSSATWINAPSSILGLIAGFSSFLYFFLPAIFGTSISKDFTSETHHVLYSYPFTKFDYFFGKFLGALVIALIVFSFVGIGVFIGVMTPGINQELLGPNSFMPYLKTYSLYVFPNILIFGAIIFIVVSATRNVTLGYIIVIILLFQDTLTAQVFDEMDNKFWGALLDPFGFRAHLFYAEYWTIEEQNVNPIPSGGYVLLNRALWLAIGGVILGMFYRYFKLSQSAFTFFKSKDNEATAMDTQKHGRPLLSVSLPVVNFANNIGFNLRNIFSFAWMHLNYIVRNTAFIIFALLGIAFLLTLLAFAGQILNTETLPLTEQILNYGSVTYLFILILTFLFSGFLLHREKEVKIDQLVDATQSQNFVHLSAKFLAIIAMQAILLLLIMVSGIAYQLYKGFYDINIGLYLFDLVAIRLWYFIPWAALAFLIHHLVPNKYVGFIILLGLFIGIPFLDKIGLEQSMFKFNQGGSTVSYSALDGYGTRYNRFMAYRSYWFFLGVVFLFITSLIWRRGYSFTIGERLAKAKKRMNLQLGGGLALSLIAFLSMGFFIYNENNVKNKFTASKEREQNLVDWEKTYKKYEKTPCPRITAVNVNLDLVPENQTFKANGQYQLVNKTGQNIDTLLVNYVNHPFEFEFDKTVELALEDKDMNFSIYELAQPLLPGDTMNFTFKMENRANTAFRVNSGVQTNGTFMNNLIFPSFGYSDSNELTDNKVRKKYDLAPKERMPHPTDTAALANTYISGDADWIDFETTISTAPDQIAIAPGYLQKEWEENGRKYFHYKMDSKMLNFYNFVSGRYAVKKDKWKDINIEIYYHEDHTYNLDRFVKGLKKGFDYFTTNFSPYQHKQVRIIEFPTYYGGFAQSFANTIPFSESAGFIASVDESEEGGVDYPFSVTAHELAHQWWAHQVIGAKVQGATLMSESLSEYSSLKVLEKEYGADKMRIFLKDALDKYLMGRTTEQKKEKALMYNENQQYIHYQKGSLVLYAMSDYLGEDKFNGILSSYIDSVAFQEAPYTTSLEFVGMIAAATPDSLKYLIKDMFETITLYNNKVMKTESEELDNGQYKVTIDYHARKYRTNEKGRRVYADEGMEGYFELNEKQDTVKSLPLADYIEIGVFGEDDKELYLQKHKITNIFGSVEIIVDEAPEEVGIDPYNKLIDTQGDDNRRKL
ncbi:MAG: M1 family aminopeptidase [Saprospiraceae bacterium]